MAYTGYKRSLSVSVTKLVNGNPDTGYPKTYPTATDISNGYFTYNAVQYSIPTPTELAEMEQSEYDSLVANFKLYVLENEDVDFDTEFSNDNQELDETTCSNVALTNGLIEVWEMDGTATTLVGEKSAHSGTLSNVIVNQAGKIGQAHSYVETSSAQADVSYNAALTPSAFSFSVWVKADASDLGGIIRGAGGSGSATGWQIFKGSTDYRFRWGNGTALEGTLNSLANYTTGMWYHLVVTYDGTTVKWYSNNSLQSESTATIGYSVSPETYPLQFGIGSGLGWLDGDLDQAAMWSRALTTDEISVLYNSGNGLAYSEF